MLAETLNFFPHTECISDVLHQRYIYVQNMCIWAAIRFPPFACILRKMYEEFDFVLLVSSESSTHIFKFKKNPNKPALEKEGRE